MSLIWCDSFQGYTAVEIPNYWNPVLTSPPTYGQMNIFFGLPARTGTQAIAPSIFGIGRGLGIPPISPFDTLHGAQQSVVIGAAYNFPVSGALPPGFIFRFYVLGLQGHIMLALSWLANGVMQITRGDVGTVVATTDPTQPIRGGMYNFIEWKTGFSNASLNEIRINGQTVYSGVLDGSIIVGATTYTAADHFAIFGPGLYDDLYVAALDTIGVSDFVGDASVLTLIPAKDGNYAQWTTVPLVLQNYLNVKEIPLDFDGSYNKSVGSGSADTYGVSPAIATTDKVVAAQLVQAVADPDNDGQQARPFIEVNGAVFTTPFDNYTPGSYLPVRTKEYEQNPITTAPWVPADINLTNWGIEQV